MVRRIGYPLLWLVPLLLIAVMWSFGGPGSAVDTAIVRWLQHARLSSEITPLAIAVTEAGSYYSTVGLSLLASVVLLALRQWRRALLIAPPVMLARLTANLIKEIVERPRPDLALHPVSTNSWSFPSGHATNSVAAFLALALFLAPPRWRTPAIAVAVLASVAVGISRPLLGVHWPSDVIAGWTLGASVIVAAWRLFPAEQQHQIVGRHRPSLD